MSWEDSEGWIEGTRERYLRRGNSAIIVRRRHLEDIRRPCDEWWSSRRLRRDESGEKLYPPIGQMESKNVLGKIVGVSFGYVAYIRHPGTARWLREGKVSDVDQSIRPMAHTKRSRAVAGQKRGKKAIQQAASGGPG
jgi:hypothetical protein